MSLQPICRIGDHSTGTCNGPGEDHPRTFFGTWITGSGNMFDDGIPIVRVGDLGTTDCNHNIVAQTGSTIADNDGIPVHRIDDLVTVVEGGSGVSITGSSVWSAED